MNIHVRKLAPWEVGLCVTGGHRFAKEAGNPKYFNAAHFMATWPGIIARDDGFILGMFDGEKLAGALAAIIGPDLLGGVKTITEAFWFALPEYRGHGMLLLDEVERLAREAAGIEVLGMIHLCNLHPKAMTRIYERRGFKEVEHHFIKSVKG